MRLNATDADEPNNLNSKIAFKIISQSPSSAFSMNKDTGEVQVATINLDREVKKKKVSVDSILLVPVVISLIPSSQLGLKDHSLSV